MTLRISSHLYLARRGLPALVACALMACGGGGGGGGGETQPPKLPPVTGPVDVDIPALRRQVEAFVAEQKAKIEAIDCRQSQAGDCEPVRDIRFSQGQALPAKLRADQTVLLIDNGFDHAATLRYRSRVLGYYRVSESSGLVEPRDTVIPVTPRWGAELLRGIDGFQYRLTDAAGNSRLQPAYVPADWLKALQPLVKGSRDFVDPLERISHGNMVLAQLVESSPQAGFVLLDPPPIGSLFAARREQVCARDAAALEQGAQRLATSLREVMVRHGVDYVNLSDGLDAEFMQAHWARLGCAGALSQEDANRLMLALRPLFAQLFETPEVLGVQSAGSWRSGLMSPLTHPLDVLELPHRVRVSYFHPLQAAPLPADGVTGSQRPEVEEPTAGDRRWIDFFLCTGMTRPGVRPEHNAAPPLNTSAVYGLGLWPLDSAATSWSAPHALNRLIFLKQRLAPALAPETPLDAALIGRMKEAMTPMGCSWAPEDGGRCKLQDPGWHRQQELFRQGWLGADWRWDR